MLFRGRILAALGSRRWNCVLIEAGLSKNGAYYPADDLRRAVKEGMFERRPACAFDVLDSAGRPLMRDHLRDQGFVGRTPLNVVGLYENTRFDEAAQSVVGDLVLLPEDPVADELQRKLEALQAGQGLDVIGLSIDGVGDLDASGRVTLRQITSVDVVTDPAAGGRIVHRIAASGAFAMKTVLELLRTKFARLAEGYSGPADSEFALARHIQRRAKESKEALADLLDGLQVKGWKDDKRFTEAASDPLALIDEALMLLAALRTQVGAPPAPPAAPPATPAAEAVKEARPGTQPSTPPVSPEEKRLKELEARTEAILIRESRQALREACASAKLPQGTVDEIVTTHGSRIVLDEERTRIVASYQKAIDGAIAARQGGSIEVVRQPADRLTEALAHMFSDKVKAPAEGRQPWMGSFRAFLEENFLGRRHLREAFDGQRGRKRLSEAVDSTNFDQVFADALDRSLLAEYQGTLEYTTWQKLVRKVPYNDFRTHRVINLGYYGTLPTVAKGSGYTTLTTPSDREETIALAKKGGLEEILMEDLLNDDLGLWQSMIRRLGRAAMETAYETVFTLLRVATQPTMSDSYALTSASRSPVNRGTAVLSADGTGKTNLIASIVAMMKGTGGSGQKKGVVPRYCVIPLEKVEAYAYVVQSLRGGVTGTDLPEAIQKMLSVATPEPVIDLGTANTTDWTLLADPSAAEVLRFATLGGREDPEIFIADDKRFGSLFTHDKLELKIRFIFACAAVDWLGAYTNDAAS